MQTQELYSRGRSRTIRITLIVIVAGLLLGAWFATHYARTNKSAAPPPMAPMTSMSSMGAPPLKSSPLAPDASSGLQIDLSPDDLQKAQIQTVPITAGAIAASLRTPGVVKANEYTEVHVTPLVGGLVKQVPVLLGDHVRRGQPLAVLFSSELAEAEMTYIVDLAELEADRKKLERTRTLLELGAASQQEEEDLYAAHASRDARVQASHEKLQLLGATNAQLAALARSRKINANLVVPAPINGVVLMRAANLGLVATPAQELFTIADLSKVWVQASLNEKDLASVRIGSPATITTPSYPDRTWRGRVVYIQPQVDPTTRTAQARVEVANLNETLRIDM